MQPTQNIKESTSTLKDAVRDYAAARVELISIESKEAAKVGSERITKGIAAAVLLLFAWACFLTALILVGEKLTSQLPEGLQRIGGGALAALILAIIHAIGAFPLLKAAKRKLAQPLFEYTKSELKKDREWLEQKTR